MKERPILFSVEMVRALILGTKTQTRRVIKPQPPEISGLYASEGRWYMPPGEPADIPFPSCPYSGRLWVKETWQKIPDDGGTIVYRATDPDWETTVGWTWKPSIFMRREYSRLTLEIVSVKVERLQNISGPDAIAEGWPMGQELYPTVNTNSKAQDWYHRLWDSINGNKYPWSSNCWVWAITFKKL